MNSHRVNESRVLVLAPTSQDANLTVDLLARENVPAAICRDMADLVHKFEAGCGAILLAEEILGSTSVALLVETLSQQPSWSDVPITIITSAGEFGQSRLRRLGVFGPSGNVTLLERPFRRLTLLSTLEVALRSRRRQYQVRDLLEEREQAQKNLREHATTLEQKVDERTAELNEKVAELESFSYSISHDMRQPLRAMQAFAQILTEDYGDRLDERGRKYLERIRSAAVRLDHLIRDVLTYSRITRSNSPFVVIDLDKLLREVVDGYPELRRARIEISNSLAFVRGHEVPLTQCISNLLGNAVKFVEPGEEPKVHVWTDHRDQFVRLWIEDEGIGIAPEDRERIFQIFSRVHHEKAYEGTGIGLSIVRKAIERMGGRVGVESELGKGSRFWIELPKG
jgi:signal transduction histidine kinase